MNFRKVIDEINTHGNGLMLNFKEDLDISNLSGKYKFGMKDLLSAFKQRAKFNSSKKMNPIASGLADYVNWVLYDNNSVAQAAAVAANFKFFTQPIGTNSKTKANTNLEQVSRLPDPEWMNAIGIGFQWAPNTHIADIVTFLNTYYQELWVGGRTYVEGPFNVFPGANGVGAVANMNTAALALTFANGNPAYLSTNGANRIDNMFDLRLPAGIHLGFDPGGVPVVSDGLTGVTILQGQNFKVECNAPGGGFTCVATALGGFGLNLMCYIYGIKSRGVQ